MKSLTPFDPDADTVTITCPHCGEQRSGKLGGGVNMERTLLLRCSCKEYYALTLNIVCSPNGQKYLERAYQKLKVREFNTPSISGGTLTVVCPSCARMRQLEASKTKSQSRSFHVSCKCGSLIKVRHDRRKSKRKPTNLLGNYTAGPSSHAGGSIQVFDLSLHGIGFTPMRSHDIAPGHELELVFDLNDFQNTRITRRAVVRYVGQDSIGCEFLPDQHTDKNALSFFVQHD